MIEVKKTTDIQRQCQACMQFSDKTYAMHVINRSYSMQVLFCEKCMNELKRKLMFKGNEIAI